MLAAKRRGHDALQAGVDLNTPETIAMLASWADVILVAETAMSGRVPAEFAVKCVDSGLGADRWGNPLHPELGPLCDAVVARL